MQMRTIRLRPISLGLWENPLFPLTNRPLPPIIKDAHLYGKTLRERFLINESGTILHHWLGGLPAIYKNHAQWAKDIYNSTIQSESNGNRLMDITYVAKEKGKKVVFHIKKKRSKDILVELYI